jgi:hypothetical protein
VTYRPDILALYGDLFRETHAALEKRAGIFSRLRGLVPRGQAAIGAAQAEAAAAKAQAAAVHQEAVRMTEAAQQAQRAAQQQATQHATARSTAEQAAAHASQRSRNIGIAAGVGLPVAAGGGYLLGRPSPEELEQSRSRNRNVAFGAGMAAGLTTPFIVRGLGQLAGSMYGSGDQGFMPGAYPSLLPGQGY